MAPEHEIVMRDGTKKRADEISINESLMPFYRSIDKNNSSFYEKYEKIYNPRSGKYERRERGIKLGYRKEFKEYNESILHTQHNVIRQKTSKESWIGEGRINRIQKMNIHFV